MLDKSQNAYGYRPWIGTVRGQPRHFVNIYIWDTNYSVWQKYGHHSFPTTAKAEAFIAARRAEGRVMQPAA